MRFSPVVALAAFIATTSALTTGHHARAPNHRAIAARVAQPAAVTDNIAPTVRKRANAKRCRPRPSSSAALHATTSKDVVKPTTTQKEEAEVKPTTHKPEPTPAKPATTEKDEPTTAPHTTPKPTPTPTKEPAPATSTKPSSGGGSGLSFMAGTQTGQGTFYATGLGACGITNNDGDYIAAVSHLLFDAFPGYNGANPNNNPMCGRKVKATYKGKTVTVTLTDRCEACALTDLDFSPSAFNQLADFSVGRISGMTWVWV